MVPHLPYFAMNTLQTLLGVVVLMCLIRSRELKHYWPLLAMAMWQAPAYFVLMYVRFEGRSHLTRTHAYHLYFITFWFAFAVATVCSLIFPYILFRTAMRPLKGLQQLGNIVFTWVAIISTAIAASVVSAPGAGTADNLILAVSQLERLSGILIVSLVAFVATAIKPLGLSVRSRVFGSSIGTLLVAATTALQATRLAGMKDLYSPYAMVQLTCSCIAQAVWIYYFALPEPQRRFILLPTTSPFHHWNRISEMLGHEPGFVAIGGVAPEAFASAEIEIFRRASANMKALENQRDQDDLPSGTRQELSKGLGADGAKDSLRRPDAGPER